MTKFNAILFSLVSALFLAGCYSGPETADEDVATAQLIDIQAEARTSTIEPTTVTPKPEETAAIPTKPVEPIKTYGLDEIDVVCGLCDKEVLAGKTEGIRDAMEVVRQLIGDIVPQYKRISFHLSGDEECGTAEEMEDLYGYVTGYTDGSKICLFDLEKTNRAREFSAVNVTQLIDQLLPVHEVGHIWFDNRSLAGYSFEEPLVKVLSFQVSGSTTHFCSEWKADEFTNDLCFLGLSESNIGAAFRAIADAAMAKGASLDALETAKAMSSVIKGAEAAFEKAGLL